MNSLNRVPFSEFAELYPNGIDLFICCASFETRCLSVAKSIKPNGVGSALICAGENTSELGPKFRANKSILHQRFGTSAHEVPIRISDPIFTANSLVSSLTSFGKQSIRTCVVDITTFTHEALLILLRVLMITFREPGCQINFVYTAAREYSVGDSDAKKWLTEGVSQVRSVLGYAGELNPAKGLHLVLLMGFESARAKRLIELFEPAKVSLGIGRKATSVNENHYKVNMFNFKNLAIRKEEVERFNFSCTNPDQTCTDLRKHLIKYSEYNTVIATLNTKLSTLGAGLYCIEMPQTQLCYAQATLYNVKGYSTPDDFCYVYTPKNLL